MSIAFRASVADGEAGVAVSSRATAAKAASTAARAGERTAWSWGKGQGYDSVQVGTSERLL